MDVKTSAEITEEPWAFLEKELEQFQKVLKELEEEETHDTGSLSTFLNFVTLFNSFSPPSVDYAPTQSRPGLILGKSGLLVSPSLEDCLTSRRPVGSSIQAGDIK